MKNVSSENTSLKVNWQGKIVSIQPRVRVWRYLTDNRTHYHLGYNFFTKGHTSNGKKQFTVAISEKQQIKGLFRLLMTDTWMSFVLKEEIATIKGNRNVGYG